LIDIFPLPIFFCEIFSLHFRSLKIAKTKQVNGCPTPIDSSSTFLDRLILSDPSHSALFMGDKNYRETRVLILKGGKQFFLI
jgi:hypothetical protein